MNPYRNLVLYACIAHCPTTNNDAEIDPTVLAEFNSGDASTQELARGCLLRTPANHSIFNHNIGGCAYAFLIENPFVFLSISDERLPKVDRICLLNWMKDALHDLMIRKKTFWKRSRHYHQHDFTAYCFQGDLHPVLLQLLSGGGEDPIQGFFGSGGGKVIGGEVGRGISGSGWAQGKSVGGGRKALGIIPLFSVMEEGLKKKKRFFRESGRGSKEMLVDDNAESSDCAEVMGREVTVCQQKLDIDGVGGGGRMCLGDAGLGKQKARRIWRKHVWVVLILDLAVCLILFGIWLMICHGFQCLDG